jgi:hypothetical protein
VYHEDRAASLTVPNGCGGSELSQDGCATGVSAA